VRLPSSRRFYLAKLIDLALDALAHLHTLSANPLLQSLDDPHHPMKWDGDEEMVFGKASQSPCPKIEE
jgi:hypothetical protein